MDKDTNRGDLCGILWERLTCYQCGVTMIVAGLSTEEIYYRAMDRGWFIPTEYNAGNEYYCGRD